MNNLKEEFKKFATGHSWYKHIPIDGMIIFAYQVNTNWTFSCQPPSEGHYYSFKVGPFLNGCEFTLENKPVTHYHGFHIIGGNYGFFEWLYRTYPEFNGKDVSTNFMNNPNVKILYEKECEKYWNNLKKATNYQEKMTRSGKSY